MTSLRTYIDIIGRDLASGAFRRVGASATKMGANVRLANAGIQTSMNKMSRYFLARDIGAGMLRIGRGVVRAFGAATESAAEFEYGLASVGAITKATTGEMRLLTQAATKAGIETQFSPQQAVEGLQNLATAGQNARQATSTLIPVLNLAAGSMGQLGVGEAANAVVGTLNAYQLGTDKAAGVTDKLLRITQLTNFQARDFSVGLSKAAAAGATFDQSMDDVLVTMGLLRNRNIDASVSATAVREAIRRLGADKRAQEAVGKYVEIFDDQGQMRSFVDITQDLAVATDNLTDKERNAVVARGFGARGLIAFNAISKAQSTVMRDGREVTLKGAEAIAHLRNELDDAEGTAEEFKNQLLATAKGQRILLEGTRETLSVKIGEGIAATLAPVVSALTSSGNALIRILDAVPMPLKRIVSGMGMLSTGAIALTGSIVFMNAALGMFGIRLRTVGWQIAKVLLIAAPLTAVFAGIGVGVYGVVRAIQRGNGQAASSWKEFFAQVKFGFKGVLDLFSSGALSAEVSAELEKANRQGLGRFLTRAAETIDNLKRFWSGMVGQFEAGLHRLDRPLANLRRTFDRVFGRWSSGARDATEGADGWTNAGRGVGDTIIRISEAILKVTDALLPLAGAFARAFHPDNIKAFAESIVTIADAIAAIAHGVEVVGRFLVQRRVRRSDVARIQAGEAGGLIGVGEAYGGAAEGVSRTLAGRLEGAQLTQAQRTALAQQAYEITAEQHRLDEMPHMSPEITRAIDAGMTGQEAIRQRMDSLLGEFGRAIDRMERATASKQKIEILNNIDWNSVQRGQSRAVVDELDSDLAGELGQSVQGP